MAFRVSITKQDRRRKLEDGSEIVQTRYFVNHLDPKTGRRRLPSFPTRKEAENFRNELVTAVQSGTYSPGQKTPTVREAVAHWLVGKSTTLRQRTLDGYERVCSHITGPLLSGTSKQRFYHSMKGIKPNGARVHDLLGDYRLSELTTADLRSWHQLLSAEIGIYSANRAMMLFTSILALAEEDFGVRTPKVPTQLGRGRVKAKKAILTLEQVAHLLKAAQADKLLGIYYAWPFLVGTRISEQLGVLWEDIDLGRNVVYIRRTQEMDGSIIELTKTKAGVREVPICDMLRAMLLEWRLLCPRNEKNELYQVFPSPGWVRAWPLPRVGGGGTIWYQNFRKRVWRPALKRLGLPDVTTHSARHLFISTLQAQGVEVGLVAKLAGHANPSITLSHYTHAVRGGEGALASLEQAYGALSAQ